MVDGGKCSGRSVNKLKIAALKNQASVLGRLACLRTERVLGNGDAAKLQGQLVAIVFDGSKAVPRFLGIQIDLDFLWTTTSPRSRSMWCEWNSLIPGSRVRRQT